MMDCSNYQEMISRMMDGDLSVDELAELQGHLSECENCSAVHSAFLSISKNLADDMADPPAELVASVMGAIRGMDVPAAPARFPKVRYIRTMRVLAGAACLAIALFGATRAGLFDNLRMNDTSDGSITSYGMQSVDDTALRDAAAEDGDRSTEITSGTSNQEFGSEWENDNSAAISAELTRVIDATVISNYAENRGEAVSLVSESGGVYELISLLDVDYYLNDIEEIEIECDYYVTFTLVDGSFVTVEIWLTDEEIWCNTDGEQEFYVASCTVREFEVCLYGDES